MAREEKRVSIDFTACPLPLNEKDEQKLGYNSGPLKHVHFNQRKSAKSMNATKRCAGNIIPQELNQTNVTVHEITAKLKKSFQKTENNLGVLKKVCRDLVATKRILGGCTCTSKCKKREHVMELERLLSEAEAVRCTLENKASRKKLYLEELARLQQTINNDRKQMEKWTLNAGESKRVLETKLDKSVKASRDQQILIRKLKSDNEALWKILHEVQDHLKKETHNDFTNIDTNFVELEQKCLPKVPIQTNEIKSPPKGIYDARYERDNGSILSSGNSDPTYKIPSDTSSSLSSHEQVISERFKKIVEQSETIKELISNFGCPSEQYEDKKPSRSMQNRNECHWSASGNSKNEHRIPSENEKGVRCDMNDIIKRCEELEKKVEDCSANDIRQRVMQQLNEIDNGSTTSTMDKCEYIKDQWMCTECRSEQSWKPEEHKRVREELLRCLDRITSMERNFSDARREIQILRKYIKNSAEEKEFTEKTYKREAMELRLVVDDKTKDINALKESLKEALDELQKSEYLLSKIESLENAVAQKDEDLKFVKESQSSIINQLKSSLATKTLESETIKSELDAAKQSIEKLHMLEKSKKENEKANENINTELSMLQNAILEAERQMRILQEENMLLRHNESISEKLSEKVELENQSLLNRLKISEEGFCFLKNRLDSIQSEVKYTAFHDQDISTKECSPRSEVENFGHSQLGDQNKRVNSRSREQDLIKTLLKDNHKLVEKVQEKGKTIENLKESLNSLAAEVEKQIASENVKSELEAKEKVKCQQELSEELSTIKKSLDSSHRELTSRVVGLSSELENLHEENRSLREQLNKSELNEKGRFMDACKQVETLKSENDLLNNENFDLNNENARLNDKNYHLTNENAHLLNENARLNDENARLSDENSRSKISLSSPASSSSPHSKDFDELLKENKYLRFAFSHEKLELIDSNLRKKERIKGMKKELENLRNKLHSHCDGSESQYSPKSNSSSLISECQLKNQKLKDACETILVRKKSDSSNGTSDFELELSKKNELISELEEDNKKLRSKFNLYKLDADKSDMEELQVQNMEANSVLEGELRALRNVVKELGSQSNVASNETEAPIEGKESEENIDDHSTISLEEDFSSQESGRTIIEKEKHDSLVESLRRKLKKCHSDMEKYKKGEIIQESTANLYKEKLKSLKEKIKISNEENVNLIGALECAKIENIELQEAYDELEKSRKEERCSVVAQNLMKEKLKDCKDKNKILNNENSALKEKMEEAKLEASARRERLSKLQLELELATSLKEEAMEEVKELKEALRSKEEEKVDEEELSEIVQVLNESLNEMHFESQKLISQLSETETEKKYLENEIKVSKVKTSCVEDKLREEFEEKMSELEERVRNESGKCEKMREENKELKKVKSALEEELETIQYDMHSNNVKAISERDANARESLASIDITIDDFKSDGEEKSSLGKHAKIFRRLQKENQNLRVKILQLEDGAIEMTRIVGNIERGHGHLTGTLRTHLIIQNESSEKILESSLHQYSSDFDKLEKEFERTEKKCDENKEYSNHRDYARELFTNAAGTILNIRTILSDGLAKVDSDLDKDLDREEFKNKDYKSKLWILKRRLSNVENRHGELQLKAEELNLRLNAKTAEFAVTQDELEEATRDLESREKSLEELQKEMVKMSVNNEKLEKIVRGLTERQGEYLENVLEANGIPQRAMIDIDQDQKEKMRNGGRADTAEKETHLKNVRLLKDEFSKENEALHRRINYLEKKLSQLTAERESLKKELETRGRYTALPGEGYGTIHMLRDNLKELTKENAKLKESLHSKQRLMYDMSKDLHQLRMEAALDLSGKKKNIFSKEKFERDMIKDLAEVKSRNEVLEAQLKDAEREKEKVPGDHKKLFSESQYKPGEKELESETLKREIYGLKRSARVASKDILTSEQVPSSDSLEDSSEHHSILQGEVTHLTEQIDLLQDLVKKHNLGDEYELLGRLKEDYEVIISQQKAEIEQQKVDIDKKRNRIKELISIVEDFKSDSKSPASNEESERRVEEIKYHEIQTLTDCLEEKRMQLEAWRKKAEAYQTELQLLRLQATHLFHDSFGNTGRNYSFHIEDSSSSQSHSKSITDYELQSPRTLQKTSGVSEHDVTYTVGDNQSDDEEEAEINDGEQSSEIDDEVEDANEREEDSLIFSPTNSTRTSRIPIRASDNVVSGAASRESDDEPLSCVPSSFKAVGHSNGNLALNDSQP